MLSLAFEQQGLDTQKQVVIEEFKEVCLNRPYGDLWSMFHDFVFEEYPYKWLPIGKKISHIEEVTMDMMKKFFFHFCSQLSSAERSERGEEFKIEIERKVRGRFYIGVSMSEVLFYLFSCFTFINN